MSRLIVLLLAVVALFAVWGAFQLDSRVREAVVASQGNKWKKSADYRFHSAVRKFGDWPPLMAACLVGFLVARALKSRRWMRIVAAAMIASTLAGVIANASRLTTGRTRPKESPPIEQGFYGPWHEGHWLIGQTAYNSFPSGHTATAFGLAAVLVFACPLLGIPALVGASIIAWSSIAMGAHHPSDVIVSILLAFVVGWHVWKWAKGPGGNWIEKIARLPSGDSGLSG